MRKTKLLLVFGRHGGAGIFDTPNWDFFKRTVGTFLNEETAAKRKAIVISEEASALTSCLPAPTRRRRTLNITTRTKRKLKGKEFTPFPRDVLLEIQKREQEINEIYAKTLNIGKPHRFGIWDLGFEETAVKINQKTPNQITFLCEAQHLDIIESLLNEEVLRTVFDRRGSLEDAYELVKAMLENTHLRDVRLVEQIIQLIQMYPNCSIAVPRGQMHYAMKDLFDNELFELFVEPVDIEEIREELRAEDWGKEAPITMTYFNLAQRYPVSEKELMEFAQIVLEEKKRLDKI